MTNVTISRVPILPLGIVNAHLLISENGCVLVDTGLPGSERKIIRALARHGLSLQDLRLIVVTHAHVDHAGSAAKLRALSHAPIVAHVGDLPYYQQEKPMTFCSTGGAAPAFLWRSGLIREPYTAFTPDIVLSDAALFSLEPFGISGHIEATLGHTAGSISVVLSDTRALVGDLLASGMFIGGIARTEHARRPPFEDDPSLVATELERLVASGASQFFLGHGGPVTADEARRHARELRR
jgi:glyoxylase-like metal-dependent hydrolase (beta-lactamase superfamily II)